MSVVFALTFVVYSLTTSWRPPISIDVSASAVAAYQLASTGTPWLENLVLAAENPWFVAVNGHIVSNRQVGISLLGVPFYVVTGTPFALWPAALAAVTFASGAVAMMHGALRPLVSRRTAIGATIVMAFGSPTWTVSSDGLWGHTITQFAIAGGALFASRNHLGWAAASLAFGILGRPHFAVISAIVGVGLGFRRRSPRVIAVFALWAMLAVLLVISLNRWVFGTWSLTGYGGYGADPVANLSAVAGNWQSATNYLVNWAGLLVAPERGLFIWTPVALLLLPAAWRARRTAPDWVALLALGGLGYAIVQMQVNLFHGGDGFYGYRHALELFTCALPLLTIGWQHASVKVRRVAVFLVVLQVCAMFLGAVNSSGLVPQEAVWRSNTLVQLLRAEPAVAGPLFALFVVLGAYTVWKTRGWTEQVDGAPAVGGDKP